MTSNSTNPRYFLLTARSFDGTTVVDPNAWKLRKSANSPRLYQTVPADEVGPVGLAGRLNFAALIRPGSMGALVSLRCYLSPTPGDGATIRSVALDESTDVPPPAALDQPLQTIVLARTWSTPVHVGPTDAVSLVHDPGQTATIELCVIDFRDDASLAWAQQFMAICCEIEAPAIQTGVPITVTGDTNAQGVDDGTYARAKHQHALAVKASDADGVVYGPGRPEFRFEAAPAAASGDGAFVVLEDTPGFIRVTYGTALVDVPMYGRFADLQDGSRFRVIYPMLDDRRMMKVFLALDNAISADMQFTIQIISGGVTTNPFPAVFIVAAAGSAAGAIYSTNFFADNVLTEGDQVVITATGENLNTGGAAVSFRLHV